MTTDLLSFKHVSASYGPIVVLRDISLSIKKNEIVTLIGANGAGKSTLMMSIFGHPRIHEGDILFENAPIHHLPTYKIAPLGIAISPEQRRIFHKLSIEDNLQLGVLKSVSKTQTKIKFDFVFSLFPILFERRNQRAGLLSGGEQQMLSIGRALMSSPKLLLLDEPSLGLAPLRVQQIFSALKTIANEGTALFVVEQNAYQALRLADRGYVIVNGQIQLSGNAAALIDDPKVKTLYLGK